MADLLVPFGLYVLTVIAALRMPTWRTGIGPALELVAISVLLEIHALGAIEEAVLPARCVMVTFITYVVVRTHTLLAKRSEELPADSERPAPWPRWNPLATFRSRFDRSAVTSSLHLFPFAAFVLLATFSTGTYVPRQAAAGYALVAVLPSLHSRRFAVGILILLLFFGFYLSLGADP